ncbi:type II secretion system F family protein [Streptomyces sp. NRRL S-337]|uniref:type II secretion system F family protein n=1 Tax=Streptomyces sp. NRRL S-337 TaxID=1463900 RepID=UPI00099DC44E|nr:type II secretion system F family protein [Streptomyces sp. NRRL S-337]
MNGAAVALVGAVVCAGAAARLAAGGREDVRRRARAVLGGDAGDRASQGRAPRLGEEVRAWCAGRVTDGERRWRLGRRVDLGRELWCLPAGLTLGVLGGSVLPVLAAPVAGYLVRRWLAGRRAERARERRTTEVIGLCAAVAGELRAGRQPAQALYAAGDPPALGPAGRAAAAAARYGGDVPRALRAAARQPGAEGLTAVAACWQVAVEGGAGLAAGLERIAAGLRVRRELREELRAQLAGPRATALMLALLPVGGLLMGTALGADPLGVLLHSPAGWGCLVLGGLLEWGGVAWTTRIVAEAEGTGGTKGVRGAQGTDEAEGADDAQGAEGAGGARGAEVRNDRAGARKVRIRGMG